MHYILVKGPTVVNVDNDEGRTRLEKEGWRELSSAEIAAAGMTGYEHIVGPHNTNINAAGSIAFTPPEPPSDVELYENLRIETAQRLAETDMYGMDDYPDNEKRAVFRAYRADLRALNRQPGAPWDGGGKSTPWPELPKT